MSDDSIPQHPHTPWYGFDVRVALTSLPPAWMTGRRGAYLHRADVLPLSVDLMVWPSIFRDEHEPSPKALPGEGTVLRPAWVGPNAPLWESEQTLQQHLASVGGRPEGALTIGISRVGSQSVEPALPSRGELLGYDVADDGLVSGLMNCGGQSAPAVEGSWADVLNDHHLFNELADAHRFCVAADRYVSEHAPFSVYGLWVLASN